MIYTLQKLNIKLTLNTNTMKPEELRIGNLLHPIHLSGYAKVIEIMVSGIGIQKVGNKTQKSLVLIDSIHRLEPIPLTEEWLLKFGYSKADEFGGIGFRKGNMILFLVNFNSLASEVEDYSFEIEFCANNCKFKERTHIIRRLDNVHQLQNLYFALTGAELTIN